MNSGRFRKGQKPHNKVCEDVEKQICEEYTHKRGMVKALSEKYGVSGCTVTEITKRNNLRRVDRTVDLDNCTLKEGVMYIHTSFGDIKVDLLCYRFMTDRSWRIDQTGSGLYYYVAERIRNAKLLHRMLINCESSIVDHANRDTLDNRLCNLRTATHQQNACNRKADKRNKLGLRGIRVCGQKRFKSYTVLLGNLSSRTRLGPFRCIQEAKIAYNKKAKEMYGEFAYQHEI